MPYLGSIPSSPLSVVFYEYSESCKSCTLIKMIGYFEFKSSCSYIQRISSGCISRRYDDQSSNQPMIQYWQSVKQSAYLSVCLSVCLSVWQCVCSTLVCQSVGWSVRQSVYFVCLCLWQYKIFYPFDSICSQLSVCRLSICLVRDSAFLHSKIILIFYNIKNWIIE